MKLSCFIIIKNEAEYVGYCIMSILPYIDEFVFCDGNSTDGTIEIIEYIKKKYDKDNKIKLFKNKDCKDLRDDYVKLFNWTLKQCSGDYVWFLHPDMIVVNPEIIRQELEKEEAIRYSIKMVSFAGDHKHIWTEGRTDTWATIFANKHGLHYWGWYGDANEDLYFRDITGSEHILYKTIPYLSYEIVNTKITAYHYCDTKPYKRRLGRMRNVLNNYVNINKDLVNQIALSHPRVTLQKGVVDGRKFEIEKFRLSEPKIFGQYKEEFKRL